MGAIGRKGRNKLATIMEKTFPKFELAVMERYLSIFPNTLRPSNTPLSKTRRLFLRRIMSADS